MKLKHFLIMFFVTFMLFSCNQNDDNIDKKVDEKGSLLSTKNDKSMYEQITNDILNLIDEQQKTRSTDLISEEEAKTIVEPLSYKGAEIVDELILLAQEDKLEMSEEEIAEMQALQPDQLAAIAYFLHSTQLAVDSSSPTDASIPNIPKGAKYDWRDVQHCIWSATGLEAITGLYGYVDGTVSLITAKTAFSMARAFIGRTLGWIGVAYAIYDFSVCMKQR